MHTTPSPSQTIEIAPCASDRRSFRWVIRASDGSVVRASPYAFATAKGARISAECWVDELAGPIGAG